MCLIGLADVLLIDRVSPITGVDTFGRRTEEALDSCLQPWLVRVFISQGHHIH